MPEAIANEPKPSPQLAARSISGHAAHPQQFHFAAQNRHIRCQIRAIDPNEQQRTRVIAVNQKSAQTEPLRITALPGPLSTRRTTATKYDGAATCYLPLRLLRLQRIGNQLIQRMGGPIAASRARYQEALFASAMCLLCALRCAVATAARAWLHASIGAGRRFRRPSVVSALQGIQPAVGGVDQVGDWGPVGGIRARAALVAPAL